MSLPDEQFRALMSTREFLSDLLDPKATPKVPKEIRDRAARCIRHYPRPWDYGKVYQCYRSIKKKVEELW